MIKTYTTAYAIAQVGIDGNLGPVCIFSEENPTTDLRRPIVVLATIRDYSYAEAYEALKNYLDSPYWKERGLICQAKFGDAERDVWRFTGKDER